MGVGFAGRPVLGVCAVAEMLAAAERVARVKRGVRRRELGSHRVSPMRGTGAALCAREKGSHGWGEMNADEEETGWESRWACRPQPGAAGVGAVVASVE